LAYLASLWLFPQWNPIYGLLFVLGLAGISGLYTFRLSLRDSRRVSGIDQADASLSRGAGGEPAKRTNNLHQPPATIAGPEAEARRHLREQIATLRTARRAARRAIDISAESACLLELGNAYRHGGQPRRASFFYEQCLCLSRQVGDHLSEATALGNLCLTYADLGQLEKAIDYYEQYLRIARVLGDRPAEARASLNLGASEISEAIEPGEGRGRPANQRKL
jgi:tetratricopeptide (TPR) repeat protein